MSNSSERNMHMHTHTGLELLRIVAMLMIVSVHYLGHGGILNNAIPYSFNWYMAWLLESLTIIGVNCYVLISGYFLINKNRNSLKKACKLWIQVFTYSFFIFIIAYFNDTLIINVRLFLKSLLPIKFSTYWFVTAYIAMYILFPYLNIIAKNLNKKEYERFLFVLFILFSVYSFGIDTFAVKSGYSFLWFVTLYFFGGYIGLYGLNIANDKKKLFLSYLLLSLLVFISKVVMYRLDTYSAHGELSGILLEYNSPLVLASAIVFFLFFKNLEIHNIGIKMIINFFAPLTFGVYLISENYIIRDMVWKNYIQTPIFYNSKYFLIHYLGSILIVFIVCLKW